MRFRNLLATALALAASASAPVLGATSAPAAAMTNAAAHVTIVHGVPSTPVDVYVNGNAILHEFKFASVTPALKLPPGTYALAVRPAGSSSSSSPILSANVTLKAGENASVVANLTAVGKPALNSFVNPTSSIPSGDARLIVRHVAAAPAVDVYAGTTKVISGLANPDQNVLLVPAGTITVRVDVAGTMSTVIGPATLKLRAGSTTVVYAIGSASAKNLTVAEQFYYSPQSGM